MKNEKYVNVYCIVHLVISEFLNFLKEQSGIQFNHNRLLWLKWVKCRWEGPRYLSYILNVLSLLSFDNQFLKYAKNLISLYASYVINATKPYSNVCCLGQTFALITLKNKKTTFTFYVPQFNHIKTVNFSMLSCI